jgi:hypothetical protein
MSALGGKRTLKILLPATQVASVPPCLYLTRYGVCRSNQ